MASIRYRLIVLPPRKRTKKAYVALDVEERRCWFNKRKSGFKLKAMYALSGVQWLKAGRLSKARVADELAAPPPPPPGIVVERLLYVRVVRLLLRNRLL